MILKARWIVPITAPPIENGWVRLEDGVIMDIGQGTVAASQDMGHCALFPGLINAHAHLEFGPGNHPKDSFAAWAQSVQTTQQQQTEAECERQWQQNAQRLLATGTTTVVNHSNKLPSFLTPSPFGERAGVRGRRQVVAGAKLQPPPHPNLLPKGEKGLNRIWMPHILHICEIVGSAEPRAAESYRRACQQRLHILNNQGYASVSPTSLYAVAPKIWEEFIKLRDPNSLISIHLKESEEENALFEDKQGALAKLIKIKGGEPWLQDPITWLRERQLLGPKTLIIHGNYLSDNDIRALQGTEASVIHCPGSHAYFGHQRFPLEIIRERKINIALGTDSLASNNELSLLHELRLMKTAYPDLSPAAIVRMATQNGAQAIGDEQHRGSLEIGKIADMIAVPCNDGDPYAALLATEQVVMTIRDGEIVYE